MHNPHLFPTEPDISSNNRSYLTIFSWGVCRLSLESYNKKVGLKL